MDAIFHSSSGQPSDSADTLIVGFEDGSIHLSIYDFFDIGVFSTRQISPSSRSSKVILQSNHPLSSTHALLLLDPFKRENDLSFVPFDLRLISETGRYLSMLASKSTQIHYIIRYIEEVQEQLYIEFKASQDLPHKFIRNMEEALQEKDQCGFVDALYHQVATGHCYPSVKEWLVDELGERVCLPLETCKCDRKANIR